MHIKYVFIIYNFLFEDTKPLLQLKTSHITFQDFSLSLSFDLTTTETTAQESQ